MPKRRPAPPSLMVKQNQQAERAGKPLPYPEWGTYFRPQRAGDEWRPEDQRRKARMALRRRQLASERAGMAFVAQVEHWLAQGVDPFDLLVCADPDEPMPWWL